MKIASALAFTAALLASAAGAKQEAGTTGKVLYRYTDEKGVPVLDYLVPPRYVVGGYEVLTLSGRVIRVVPPQLSGEKLAEQQRREAQAEEDKNLLKRYNSAADIESARARKLAIVQQDMAILRSNISNLRSQIDYEEAAAARTQRNGGAVAPELLQRINDLRKEIGVLQERVATREKEALRINAEFDQASKRYTEIAER